jgi:hypothetical protein
MHSISENDFECFAKTGVKAPGTTLPDSGERRSEDNATAKAIRQHADRNAGQ